LLFADRSSLPLNTHYLTIVYAENVSWFPCLRQAIFRDLLLEVSPLLLAFREKEDGGQKLCHNNCELNQARNLRFIRPKITDHSSLRQRRSFTNSVEVLVRLPRLHPLYGLWLRRLRASERSSGQRPIPCPCRQVSCS